jgi:hypothetical protein
MKFFAVTPGQIAIGPPSGNGESMALAPQHSAEAFRNSERSELRRGAGECVGNVWECVDEMCGERVANVWGTSGELIEPKTNESAGKRQPN